MVVNGRRLAWPPDKTLQRESFVGIAVQQILLVVLGVGSSKVFFEPVVVADELGKDLPSLGEKNRLRGLPIGEVGECPYRFA